MYHSFFNRLNISELQRRMNKIGKNEEKLNRKILMTKKVITYNPKDEGMTMRKVQKKDSKSIAELESLHA